MKFPYFQNYLGVRLTPDEFEDIKHPYLELYTHVTMKTVQAGAILGTCLIGPLRAMGSPSSRNWIGLYKTCTRYGRNGVLIGLVAGLLSFFNLF